MNKILVHVRAPALSLSGYGVHARQIVDYLLQDDRFEVCLESINWGHCPYIHNDPRLEEYYKCIMKFQRVKEQRIPFNLSIHVSIPNEFQRTAEFNIGVTAGIEVDRISQKWVEKCNEMDMIIVPSEFSQKVLTGTVYDWQNKQTGETGQMRITKPVNVIPEWFSEPEETKIPELELPAETNFLHVGQWGNKGGFGEDRKNIADLVRLFLTTFKDDPNVGLVLKINIIGNNEEDYIHTKRRLEEIKSNFGDVKCHLHLLHDTLTNAELWGLYKHPKIKALVSLTHGEGYGLPLLEAAAAGLPVIATDWSGHTMFLRKKHGYIPLDWEFTEIPECQVWPEVIEKGSRWAKVKDEEVAKRLRKFAGSPTRIIKEAQENIKWLQENYSKEAVMKQWKEFFDKLIVSEDSVDVPEAAQTNSYMRQRAEFVKDLVELIHDEDKDKEKVLFMMPRSAGDVLICTAIADSLIRTRHFNTPFYFATSKQYQDLLKGLMHDYPQFRVVDYNEKMMNAELVGEVWDYVYNPGVNVQYNFSNWLVGNGEYAVRLLEEFAKNCNLAPASITNYNVFLEDVELPPGDYCVFSPGGIKSAKEYKYWDDVILNLHEMMPELSIVQVGTPDEKLYDGVIDARGKSYGETLYLVKNAAFEFGVDTFTAHAAAAVDTPHVTIYGSTDANTVTPVILGRNKLQYLIETNDRHGCKNPCYKDQCFNLRDGKNCLSEISPEAVCRTIQTLVEDINKQEEENE